jgi:type IV pilus assembly protein PilC
MQKYKYLAVDLQKHKVKGVYIAKDEDELAEELAKQNLYLVSAKPYVSGENTSFFSFQATVKISELTTFCRQYAIMLNTHIPILDCLDILKNQPYTKYFKEVLGVLYEDVEGGMFLSEAMEKYKTVFPDFFRSMVKVGEISGHLDIVLTSLADYYETETSLRRKVKSAMSYPLMLLGMTVGIVILMLTVVIPTFRDTLGQLNVEITGFTKVVYDLSDFLVQWWQTLLLGVLGLALIAMLYLRTEKGKYVLDTLKLKVPILKTIELNTITSRFARALALLLTSGLDLNESMYATEIVVANRYMKERFRMAADEVRGGMMMTEAFEKYKLFPPMMIQMITIGEKTNALDEVLTRSCKFFDDQVESSVTSLANKLQPAMLLIMGVVIIALFLAVYSPMLSIMQGLNV